MNAPRGLVYRCVESLLNLEGSEGYRRSLVSLYGAETVRPAEALLDRSERFFGLHALGLSMEGSDMHQGLLKAYDKLFA